ncbi:uncharacterized protein TNIN_191391 [Trichonephila inaurata madagascariensis]|uniref:Uncharacterized protein n=1 Tax=Trichonephila inaurata madagascariensis TaxID=2747483 RepID=A0A8X6JHP9_9ARAC|nr:uncharacterized protein TNIN_191391 [Trichonephila inaurata madagascariensis]
MDCRVRFHIAKRKSVDFSSFPNGHGLVLFSYTCCSCLHPIYLYPPVHRPDMALHGFTLDPLVVFENYSEPADLLRDDLSILRHDDESDPVYMAPVDDATQSSWANNDEEDMYCVPYEGSSTSSTAPPLPSPCMGPVSCLPKGLTNIFYVARLRFSNLNNSCTKCVELFSSGESPNPLVLDCK